MNKEYETYGMGDYTRSYRGPQDDVWPIPQNEIDTDLNLKQHKEWGGEQTNKSIIKENNYISMRSYLSLYMSGNLQEGMARVKQKAG